MPFSIFWGKFRKTVISNMATVGCVIFIKIYFVKESGTMSFFPSYKVSVCDIEQLAVVEVTPTIHLTC